MWRFDCRRAGRRTPTVQRSGPHRPRHCSDQYYNTITMHTIESVTKIDWSRARRRPIVVTTQGTHPTQSYNPDPTADATVQKDRGGERKKN